MSAEQHDSGAAGGGSSRGGAKGLLASIFDLSFEAMVTPKVIKILFVLLCVVQVIPVLFGVVSAFAASPVAGVLALLFSPVIYLIAVLFARIYLELIIVVFRIYETLRDRPL